MWRRGVRAGSWRASFGLGLAFGDAAFDVGDGIELLVRVLELGAQARVLFDLGLQSPARRGVALATRAVHFSLQPAVLGSEQRLALELREVEPGERALGRD